MSLCVNVMVMLSAYVVSFTGVCGVEVSDVYMLKSVGDKDAALWNTIVELALCLCFVSEYGVCFAACDVV